MPADVLIENHGSVALFTPVAAEAHQWVEENVHVEPWQWLDCSIAYEPRCLGPLVEGMLQDGLAVMGDPLCLLKTEEAIEVRILKPRNHPRNAQRCSA